MKRIAVAIIVIVFLVGAWLWVQGAFITTPTATPIIRFKQNITPINNDDFNITQGSNKEFNITFTSITNKDIEIPLNTLKINVINDTKWNYSVEQVLSYSFSPNLVYVESGGSNSSILAINLAQDAPLGIYKLSINTGAIIILAGDENDLTYSMTFGFKINVNPKQE